MSTINGQRRFCVNRSAQELTVHEAIAGLDSQGNPTNFPGLVVGTIRFNDFFRWCGNDAEIGTWTVLRNNVWVRQRRARVHLLVGGQLRAGFFGIEDIQNQTTFFSPAVSHRRGTVVWEGQTLHTFLTQVRSTTDRKSTRLNSSHH